LGEGEIQLLLLRLSLSQTPAAKTTASRSASLRSLQLFLIAKNS
jgi:hypothetical protein